MCIRDRMKAMEECTIEAALTGDYGKALEAFVLNPLVENNENTTKVLDELLVAHAKYLPQFKEKIEELKAKGVHSTDPVAVSYTHLMNICQVSLQHFMVYLIQSYLS